MIIKKKEHWFLMLFMWKRSVLPRLLPRLLFLLLFSVAVTWYKASLIAYKIELNPAPFTLFGIALALFLGFRNNASYDRFWEARKLWGALLNDTRSLARQALTLCNYKKGAGAPAVFINYLIAFTYALKHQLRHTDSSADLKRLLSGELAAELEPARYKPILLLREMAAWVSQAKADQQFDPIVQKAFEDNFNKLSDDGFSMVQNLGSPVNSPQDDFAYRVTGIHAGFFSSNRSGGLGKEDIYRFTRQKITLKDINQ